MTRRAADLERAGRYLDSIGHAPWLLAAGDPDRERLADLLAETRDAALEEAAKECEQETAGLHDAWVNGAALRCVWRIRALKSGGG